MDPKNENEASEGFPSIPSNDLDDENPYKNDPEDKQNIQKSDTLVLDPVKDNISDQLGLEFDYPTETKVFGEKDKIEKHLDQMYEEPKPAENNFQQNNIKNNENKNFMNKFDKYPSFKDPPNNNNINNNFGGNNFNFGNNNNLGGNNINYGNNNNMNYGNNNNVNYGNINNNNYGNNFNNFGGPNYNNNYNPPNNNNNNDEVIKKIQKILATCDTKYKNAITQFRNFQIIDSKKALVELGNNLINVEKNIKEKFQYASSLLPNIESLKTNIINKYYEYTYFTYILNASLFKNIEYQKNIELSKFAEKFIISRPFITFNDIYDTSLDPNRPTKKGLLDIYDRAQRSGNKSLFLYSPHGSGKTLYVHALANELGAVLGQLDNLQHIKIQYFVKEFARLITEYLTRPLIIYVKNVDYLIKNAFGEIMFLFDKFNSYKKNCLFICSSAFPAKNLPSQLKFNYAYCINSANQRNKYNLFKFMTNKFGIKVSMSDSDLSNFVYQNFKNYSNQDVFQVIKTAMDLKKQMGGSIFDIGRNELEKALKAKPGTLDPQCMQYYGL